MSIIAAIYGLEETDPSTGSGQAVVSIVMELVEGPTLAETLVRGSGLTAQVLSQGKSDVASGFSRTAGPPLNETLAIARQIADALEAAHEQGVTHRDLKPANIKVRDDGVVKVLDFGLAKLADPVGGAPSTGALNTNSPTLSLQATRAGVILGTAAYMSPEQARGKTVDKRTDVWAFGCVLYEMLTTQRAFAAEEISDTLALVLTKEPDWTALGASTPPPIRRLLRRCLEKDRKKRLADIADARMELDEAATDRAVMSAAVVAPPKGLLRNARVAWSAAALLLVAAIALATVLYLRRVPGDPLATRLEIFPPDGWTLAPGGRAAAGGLAPMAVSPDGRRVAFVAANARGTNHLWVRPLDSVATMVPGTEGAFSVFWSPDSRVVAFFAADKLKRVNVVTGGPVAPICDVPPDTNLFGLWTAGGLVLFDGSGAAPFPVQEVSASGGLPRPTVLPIPDSRITFLPGGRRFLARVGDPTVTARAEVQSLDAEASKTLLEQIDTYPILYSESHLLFLRDRALMAQPFDLRRLEVGGEATLIEGDVSTALSPGQGVVSVSNNGVLAYRTTTIPVDSRLIWFDRNGDQVDLLADEAGYLNVELAPDGIRAAVSIRDRITQVPDLWLYDTSRAGFRTKLTSDSGLSMVWSPDGSRIVFQAPRQPGFSRLLEKPSAGAGSEQVLLDDGDGNTPTSWSMDGGWLLFTKGSTARSNPSNFTIGGVGQVGTGDLWTLPAGGDRKPMPLLRTPAVESNGRFSPSGRWIAYQSNESGRPEIYLMPYPGPGAKVPVSVNGGSLPRWRRDGRELFYFAPDNRLMAVPVTASDMRVEVGTARPLFTVRRGAPGYFYDVSPNGQRFLVNVADREPTPAPITVLVNWTAALPK